MKILSNQQQRIFKKGNQPKIKTPPSKYSIPNEPSVRISSGERVRRGHFLYRCIMSSEVRCLEESNSYRAKMNS